MKQTFRKWRGITESRMKAARPYDKGTLSTKLSKEDKYRKVLI